jgi:drug/metabolite transporter (DMT)-like permease
MSPLAEGGVLAVLAAVSFGVTTPLVQRFGVGAGPFPTATLLYAGAALATLGPQRSRGEREAPVRRRHLARLVGVAALGAVLAPASLAWGLQHTSASGASLLLNFEAVLTALLAWWLYREPVGVRVGAALVLMVAAGALLVAGASRPALLGWGALAVLLATLAWAFDNTLTQPLSDLDPTQVVRWKASLGAGLGTLLSLAAGQSFPTPSAAAGLLACGATGYGVSLRLYLLAQRRIGATRTGSIFAVAPFVGVVAAWALGDQSIGMTTLLAAGLFALAVVLHLGESHHHRHRHEPLEHEHAHRHDDGHHDHLHEVAVQGEHSHLHRHDDRTHDHPHGPDAHHHHPHP